MMFCMKARYKALTLTGRGSPQSWDGAELQQQHPEPEWLTIIRLGSTHKFCCHGISQWQTLCFE